MSQSDLEDINQTLVDPEKFVGASNAANANELNYDKDNNNMDKFDDVFLGPTGEIESKYEKEQIKKVLKVLGFNPSSPNNSANKNMCRIVTNNFRYICYTDVLPEKKDREVMRKQFYGIRDHLVKTTETVMSIYKGENKVQQFDKPLFEKSENDLKDIVARFYKIGVTYAHLAYAYHPASGSNIEKGLHNYLKASEVVLAGLEAHKNSLQVSQVDDDEHDTVEKSLEFIRFVEDGVN